MDGWGRREGEMCMCVLLGGERVSIVPPMSLMLIVHLAETWGSLGSLLTELETGYGQ
jgi:hypothetical protein